MDKDINFVSDSQCNIPRLISQEFDKNIPNHISLFILQSFSGELNSNNWFHVF